MFGSLEAPLSELILIGNQRKKRKNLFGYLKKYINELNSVECMIFFSTDFFTCVELLLKKRSHSAYHSPELFLYQI